MVIRRSITQLLRKNYPRDEKKELALNWAKKWQRDQTKCIKRLGQAVKNNDFDEQCISLGQLKEISEKQFIALPNIINALLEIDEMEREFERKNKEYKSK